jgi:hypothetical protein
MTHSIEDLQNHFHFQLSLLRLLDIQHNSDVPSTPTVEIVEHEHLQDALARIAAAIH